MSKIEWAAEDLLRTVKSKKKYTDTFVKRYWRHQLLFEQELDLLTKIQEVGGSLSSRVHFLKLLVYLHVMLTTRCHHYPPEPILNLRFKSKTAEPSEFDNLLSRVVSPYLMYIQKRTLKAETVRSSPKSLPHTQLLEMAFQLVNLINLGCSFSKEIYKFGRYYSEEYPFLSDLNTVLGMDLRECYATLRGCVSKLWGSFSSQNSKTQNILNALIDEINTTNEKLFIVFYNTYFYTELKHFLPNWIRYEPKQVVQGLTEEDSKDKKCEIENEFSSPPPRKRAQSRVKSDLAELSIKDLQKLMMENTANSQTKNVLECSTTEKTPAWQAYQLQELEISEFETTKSHLLGPTHQHQLS